jgi:hypothetical protein
MTLSGSASEEALWGFPFPRVGEEAGKRLRVDTTEIHAHGREPLAPPDPLTRSTVAVDRGEDAALVEHHVHVFVVPLGREDLAGDAERRPSVVVLLDRFG